MAAVERSGIGFALAGFGLLVVGDTVFKTMAGEWPAYAAAALRFSLGSLGLSALLLYREGCRGFVPKTPWLQIARGMCLALASVFFVSAVYIMPLAEAVAISFLSPILTQLLAGLLLREEVKPKVYLVSLVAFAGVMIILRPNLAELGWGALLPLAAALCFALLMIANRASVGQGSVLSMQVFSAGISAILLVLLSLGAKFSTLASLDFGWPSWSVVLHCALVAITASIAHWLVYVGTMRAGAANIAPAIYFEMLVAVALGWLIFRDIPDLYTVLGAILIIAAGLYLWRDGLKPHSKRANRALKN